MLEILQNRLIAIFASSTMVIFGLLGAGQSVLLWQEWAELTTDGELITATIIAKEDNYPFGSNYRVFYEVEVQEETIINEERVPRSLYRRLNIGQEIFVRSLPDSTRPLAIEGNNSRLIGFTVTAGLWILFGLLLGLFLTTYLNRLTRLRREMPELDLTDLMATMAANANADSSDSAEEAGSDSDTT